MGSENKHVNVYLIHALKDMLDDHSKPYLQVFQEVIFTENTAPDREIWDEKGGLIKKGAAEIAERDQDHVPEVKVLTTLGMFAVPVTAETTLGEIRQKVQETTLGPSWTILSSWDLWDWLQTWEIHENFTEFGSNYVYSGGLVVRSGNLNIRWSRLSWCARTDLFKIWSRRMPKTWVRPLIPRVRPACFMGSSTFAPCFLSVRFCKILMPKMICIDLRPFDHFQGRQSNQLTTSSLCQLSHQRQGIINSQQSTSRGACVMITTSIPINIINIRRKHEKTI